MLFVKPNFIGQGIGKPLIKTATENYNTKKVDINEQNPVAKGFYEYMGFIVENRSECDDYGNPFPILHMTLRK